MNGRNVAVAAALAASLAGCASTTLGGDDAAPRFAASEIRCVAARPLPAFALAALQTSGDGRRTLIVSTPAGATPFEAYVRLSRPRAPSIFGGELAAAAVSPAVAGGRAYFAAALPGLEAGGYDVTIEGMADTDRDPECQRSFRVSLGPLAD